ncbi:MAG: glycosyltransferase [Butyrivibrio sp.]|nr:glycosyltransferase [Butyrivibrio sp.]
MNTKKIAFIICVNNDKYMDECRYYIDRLYVPEGYETDIIEVREAESMTSGYQAAMESSDAKYKIYMHQDVCLINRGMLFSMLNVFSDESIGIIGTLGGNLYPDGDVHLYWNKGSTLNAIYSDVKTYKFEQAPVYEEVEAVDGMFMATQYDIPWDQRLDGWHMYDVTQCIRFREKGYRICVSTEDNSWTLHDSGYCDLSVYDFYREMLFELYPDYFYDRKEIVKSDQQFEDDETSLKKLYLEIITSENDNYGHSKYENMPMEAFWDDYCTVKFPVRRMEFGFPREDWIYIKDWILQKRITVSFLFSVVNHVCRDPEHMATEIEKLFSEAEPKISVVMPIYNTGEQLYKTLMSVLSQTEKDFEVIMVDDCSTDELTRETERTFANFDKRFKLLAQDRNMGAAHCRNIGIESAAGKYIIFFDSDDLFCNDILAEMLATIEAEDADICIGNFMMLDIVSNVKSPIYATKKDGVTDRCFSLKELDENGLSYWMPMQGNKMLRTSFLRENNLKYQELSNCEDASFGYLSAIKAGKIVYCRKEEPLFIYRVNNSKQISYNVDSRNFLKAFSQLLSAIDVNNDKKTLLQVLTELKATAEPMISRCANKEYNDICRQGVKELIEEYSKYI